jgi:hypothetical protein
VEIYEEHVMTYLSGCGRRFICPQYKIVDENGWKLEPDFVVIDFIYSKLFIVEVSIASDITILINKIVNNKIKAEEILLNSICNKLGIIKDNIEWLIFARKDAINNQKMPLDKNIKFVDIEKTICLWKLNWENNEVINEVI